MKGIGLLVVVLTVTGCRVVFPGDGQLVVVDAPADLDWCVVTLSVDEREAVGRSGHSRATVGDAIRRGIRYWDDAGARLRTRDQLTPAELVEAASASTLHIRGDLCEEAGADVHVLDGALLMPAGAAQYDLQDGDIQLFLRRWPLRDVSTTAWTAMAAAIAHEAGHAIGLDHVRALNGIMFGDGAADRSDLSDADLAEYARVWN